MGGTLDSTMDSGLALSLLLDYPRKGNQSLTLRTKDLRLQLTRNSYCVKAGIQGSLGAHNREFPTHNLGQP